MAGNRSPYVPMRTDLVKDERVAFIADVCACSRDEVLGRLFRLWAWCTDRKLADAPDDCPGYAVHAAVVRRFLGPDGARALLGDGCSELALGDQREDGLIFLHGTEGAVASLRSLYARSQAGGEERVRTATRERGKFVAAPTNTPAGRPAATSDLPDPDPDPDQREDLPPGLNRTQGGAAAPAVADPARRPDEPRPAPAAAPPPDILGVRDHGGEARRAGPPTANVRAMSSPAAARGDNARTQPAADRAEPTLEQLWTELEQARQRAAAARGVSIRPLVAHDSGRKDLAEALVEAARVGKRAELVADVRHAIAAAEAESRIVPEPGARDQLQWFTGAIFRPNNFRRLAGTPVKTSKARPAPAPAAATAQRRSEPELTDDDKAEIAELARKLGQGRADAAAAEERARVATRPTAELVKMFGPGERAPPAAAAHDDDQHHDDHDDKESA